MLETRAAAHARSGLEGHDPRLDGLVGLIAPFANGPIHAILQATIAADYQGRVLTLVGSLAGATAPLGLLLAAPITEMVGVRAWYTTGGSVCLAMGITGFFLPSLMRIEQSPGGAVQLGPSLADGADGSGRPNGGEIEKKSGQL